MLGSYLYLEGCLGMQPIILDLCGCHLQNKNLFLLLLMLKLDDNIVNNISEISCVKFCCLVKCNEVTKHLCMTFI
jgi:hypothetical protein